MAKRSLIDYIFLTPDLSIYVNNLKLDSWIDGRMLGDEDEILSLRVVETDDFDDARHCYYEWVVKGEQWDSAVVDLNNIVIKYPTGGDVIVSVFEESPIDLTLL